MFWLALIAALLLPRLFSLYLWFATTWYVGVYPNLLWPVLAFVFVPRALLWYTFVGKMYGGAWGWWQIAVMVVALLMDVSDNGWLISRRKNS